MKSNYMVDTSYGVSTTLFIVAIILFLIVIGILSFFLLKLAKQNEILKKSIKEKEETLETNSITEEVNQSDTTVSSYEAPTFDNGIVNNNVTNDNNIESANTLNDNFNGNIDSNNTAFNNGEVQTDSVNNNNLFDNNQNSALNNAVNNGSNPLNNESAIENVEVKKEPINNNHFNGNTSMNLNFLNNNDGSSKIIDNNESTAFNNMTDQTTPLDSEVKNDANDNFNDSDNNEKHTSLWSNNNQNNV